MDWRKSLMLLAIVCLTLVDLSEAKKKKKKKSSGASSSEKKVGLFDSGSLKCLVCQSLIDEFAAAIYKIDPKKMIDTGTFRVDGQGDQKRSLVRTFFKMKIAMSET